jgi:importin subunit alpha-1
MTVVHSGAVPLFVQLLESDKDEVREQAAWALGNIAGDGNFVDSRLNTGPNPRDFVLNHGVLTPLMKMLEETTTLSIVRNCTWTLSNLCRGKPQPAFNLVIYDFLTL